MKKLMGLIIILMMLSQPIKADELIDVGNLVKEKIGFVFDVLKNKSLDAQTRNTQIVSTVSPFFDFAIMAKNSLGRKYWKSISKAQRETYTQAFIDRTRASFVDKLDLFTDETVEYKEAKKVKKRIYVMTHLISDNENIEMLYKFYKSKKGWKVYDIEILGVSIIQTYRAQFSSIMKSGGIDVILEKLGKTGEIKMTSEK